MNSWGEIQTQFSADSQSDANIGGKVSENVYFAATTYCVQCCFPTVHDELSAVFNELQVIGSNQFCSDASGDPKCNEINSYMNKNTQYNQIIQ